MTAGNPALRKELEKIKNHDIISSVKVAFVQLIRILSHCPPFMRGESNANNTRITHMTMQIHHFAEKWLNKFLDKNTSYVELVDHYMADDCKALGFEMDSGFSFAKKYKTNVGGIDALYCVIDQVTDITVLGNAIYSTWRYYNHWAYDAAAILKPANREWFIIALLRLGELAIRQHKQLQGEPQMASDICKEPASENNATIGSICQHSKTISQCNGIVGKLINTAAEQGLSAALYLLGDIHERGRWVEKNHNIAFGYYYQSALRQHQAAYLKVAEGFRLGHGIPADDEKAIHWYEQAAIIGNAEAQFRYGIAIENGIGIPADAKAALKWYLLAAAQNHAGAQYNAASCYHYGRGTEVDMAMALHYYRLSAEGGDSAAQYNLGVCCADGIGMPPNMTEAIYWYTKAAEAGYVKAQVNLAYCYQHGLGVTVDTDAAKFWYNKSAEQGDPYAIEALKSL